MDMTPFSRGALLIMSGTVVSAGLGFVFWVIAARVLSETEVGRDGALVAAMVALAAASQLNLAAALPRFLPQLREGATRVAATALGVCSLAGLLAAIAFMALVPSLTDSLETVADEPGVFMLFTAGVALMASMAVQDAALAAVRRAGWIPVEQMIYNGLRVAALALAAVVGLDHAIMVAWVVPLVFVLPVSAWLLFTDALPAHAERKREGSTATPVFTRAMLARFLAADSIAFLMRQATAAAMPIIVLAYVGPVEAAAFTVPFALVIAFDVIFFGAATSLTIEGAQHGARLAALVRELIWRFLFPTLAIAALLAAIAPIALLPFGTDYSADGATALRFLALGSAVRALLVFTEVLQRLAGSLRPVLAFSAIALLGVVALGPPLIYTHGIAGGGAAWFFAHTLAATAVAATAWRTLQAALDR